MYSQVLVLVEICITDPGRPEYRLSFPSQAILWCLTRYSVFTYNLYVAIFHRALPQLGRYITFFLKKKINIFTEYHSILRASREIYKFIVKSLQLDMSRNRYQG